MSEFHVIARTLRSKQPAATIVVGLLCSLFFLSSLSYALIDQTLFGPKRYERLKGKPTVYSDTFNGCKDGGQAVIRITNGDSKDTKITSAEISVNKKLIAREKDFKKQSPYFEKVVTLAGGVNTLTIKLKSGRHEGSDGNNPADRDDDHKSDHDGKNSRESGRDLDSDSKEKPGKNSKIKAPRKDRDDRDQKDDGEKSDHDHDGKSGQKSERDNDSRHDDRNHDRDHDRPASFIIIEVMGQGCGVSDGTPPVIANPQPADNALLAVPNPAISAQYSDETGGAGIDVASARLTVDGQDVTSASVVTSTGISYAPAANLTEGPHTAIVSVTDLAQNSASLTWHFTTDTVVPIVKITSHQNNQNLNTPTINLSGSIDDLTATVSVNNTIAPVSGNTFTLSNLALSEGQNTITVVAKDTVGNIGKDSITINLDSIAPAAPVITQPGTPVNGGSITLNGAAEALSIVKIYAGQSSAVLVGTVPADAQGRFSLSGVTLTEGGNVFIATATDATGNTGNPSTPVSVTLDTAAPIVTITTPTTEAWFKTGIITVTGTVNEPATSVIVNGTPATITGTGFSLTGVSLTEGVNTITVIATDLAGNPGSGTVQVNLDTIAPMITITSLINGSYVNTPKITVSGNVTETNPDGLWVNGTLVGPISGSFSIADVALLEGLNIITVHARDKAGNESSTSVTIILDTIAPVVTITAPESGLLTRIAQIAVSGEISEIATVSVNSMSAFVSEQTYSLGYTLNEGQNSLVATAIDRAGNRGIASIFVTLDSTPPLPPVISPLATPSPTPIVVLSGMAEAGSSVNIYAASAQTAAVLIGTVTADAQGSFSLADVTLAEGVTTFTATATDSVGNTSDPSAPVSVEKDITPPVITVASPSNNSSTSIATVLVKGSLDDATAKLTIKGAEVALDGTNFETIVTITEGLNSIVLTAEDPSANTSNKTLFITLDTVAPAVTITSPLNNALVTSSQVSVSGTVNEVVASVSVNGTSALVAGSGYSLSSYALTEGQNTITAEAIDRAGNKGSASVNITLDSIAPAVSLSAPAQAAAGSNVTLSLGASDTGGLRLVEVIADNAVLWSYTLNAEYNTSNSISFTLSPDLASGSVVNLQARAYDTAGNIGTTPAGIQINQGPNGPGYIQGEVYDDSKGLRLAGAAASISSVSLAAAVAELATPDDGGYFTEVPKGDYLVTLSKTGFTSVERIVAVKPEKKTIALDARLTPVNTAQNLIDSAGGTIKAGVGGQPVPPAGGSGAGNVELIIPANAVAAQTDIRVTPISNQGLAGSLPIGWSPIAVVDISAAGSGVQGSGSGILNFNSPTTLKVPLISSLTITAPGAVTFVSYDWTSHQWLVQNPGTVGSDGVFITATLSSTGQYALVVPDSNAAALPGSLLLSLSSSLSTLSTLPTGTGRVVPAAAPPSAGLKAVGELILSPSPLAGEGGGEGELSSGLIVNATVTEHFDLFSGDAVAPSDYVQDLVLYRLPCLTNFNSNTAFHIPNVSDVGSTFPVAPSHEYTIVDLMMGKVGISITLPEPDASGTLVGIDGGRILDTDGTVLSIPANALAKTVPIQTKTVPASTMTGIMGPDFNLLRAIDVNLTGQTLTSSAELSIPLPVGFNANLPVVIAKAIDVRGAQKLKLVAVARLSGSLITSGLNGVSGLNGIVTSGQYFFLQAKAPLGFVKGTVTSSSGAPASAALATISTCSLVDLTNTTGSYLVASTVAPFNVAATDIYKNDAGTGSGAIATANQTVTLDIAIMVTPPNVLSLTPGDNAVNVEPNAAIVVTFSEPVDKTTITAANITLKDSAGTAVDGAFSVNPESTVVTLYPSTLLTSEAQYTLTVSRNIKDLQGYTMTGDVTATFTTRDTTPPPMPAAGSITATFPDADGYVTITATQGSAEASGTVLIINDNTGEIVAVKPNSNGSFTGRILAQLGDDIKLVSMDAAGNQTLISYVPMRSPDGKYLVSAKGGTVEGEGGTKIIIPEGALDGPTVIKISPVTEDQLPQPVPENAGFLAAVHIDAGGATFKKPVKLSVPAPTRIADIPAGSIPFLSQPSELANADGTTEKVYVVHDSAKVIDGRLTTASPPFPGMLVGGFWVFEFPYFNVAIVDGYTYRDMDGVFGYQPQNGDLPVKKAVIRTPAAWHHITYSRENGFYAAFAEVIGNVPGMPELIFNLTAIHPLTMKRVNETVILDNENNIAHLLNFKLAGQSDMPPDTTPPAISFNLQVAPNSAQDASHQNARFMAGTIAMGTNLLTSISIIDRDVQTPTLTITCSGMCNQSQYSAVPTVTSSTVYTPVSQENMVATSKFTLAPNFDSAISSGGAFFTPPAAGTYTLTVEASDSAGNHSSRSLTVRAVDPASVPTDGVNGRPQVDEILPAHLSGGVNVDAKVEITFSEMMQESTINNNTVSLANLATGIIEPVSVEFAVEGSRMKTILRPLHLLNFDTTYKVLVTQGVRDLFPNTSQPAGQVDANGTMALEHDYYAEFTTKAPQAFDITQMPNDTPPFTGGRDIALYSATINNPVTGEDEERTYAYVITAKSGWRVVDVTDPTNARVVYSDPWGQNQVGLRNVAVDEDQKIMAMTELIGYGDYTGMIRFYDLAATPEAPRVVGREKLAEGSSGVPGRIAMSGGYAYVATGMIGIQVVDIAAAKSQTGITHGESIVGGLPTVDMGYGSPLDIVIHRAGKGLLTTTMGYLLTLDINPTQPQILKPYKPAGFSAWRVAAASDFEYTDDQGNTQTMDLAIVNGFEGKISTVDITDPNNPQHFTIKNGNGSDRTDFSVSEIAINKNARLAYAVAGASVLVFDLSNPRNPRLLGTFANVPSGGGGTGSTLLGYSMALMEKDGWVYLANGDRGMRLLNLTALQIEVDPKYIMLDSTGKPDTTKITYRLSPPDYQAAPAKVVVYKDGVEYKSIPTADIGGDAATFAQSGELFDLNSTYYAQVVVNAGMIGVNGEKRSQIIPFLKEPPLVTDYNRDRKIDDTDMVRAAKLDTFYFWTGHWGAAVNGASDLTNYFPVYLNIKDLLNIYDPGKFTYQLKSTIQNLRFLFTDLTPNSAGNFLTGNATSLDQATSLAYAFTDSIPSIGFVLNNNAANPTFLQQIRDNGKGIILIKGTSAGNAPLVLEIIDMQTHARVFSSNLNLSLASVEQMFRQKNLVNQGGGPLPNSDPTMGEKDRLSEPLNYPDKECTGDPSGNGKNFVFVHGYNVNPQEAREWHAEMFKRLFWSGSRAKFWGVTWYGYESQVAGYCPEYHNNVVHAFATSSVLANFLAPLQGEITIAAHSLGNVLVSSAIDLGANVKNYFLLNAAIPVEAFYAGEPESSNMYQFDWTNNSYDHFLWATEWHRLFYVPGSQNVDERSKLTWRNRFANGNSVTYFDFFSSGDDVLTSIFAIQEKMKGTTGIDGYNGRNYGGWGFNFADYYETYTTGGGGLMLYGKANTLDPAILKTKPFFKKGGLIDAVLIPGTSGSDAAKNNRDRMLAESFPALTPAVGTKGVGSFPQNYNFNMQTNFETNNQWPRSDNRWLHSDMKNVPYLYVYTLFDKFVKLGGL